MIDSKRIRALDIAKGLAMICIIIGHMGIDVIDRVVYTFHVPLFFLIAGYFASDRQSLWEVTKKRARTLLVPYCLTCIVIILLGTLYGWHRGDAVTALRDWSFASLYGSGAYYGKPFEIKAIGAIWFLWALFWACIFMRILLSFRPWLRMIGASLLFVAGYLTKDLMWFPWSIQAGACATLYLYVGVLFRRSEKAIRELPSEVMAACYLAAALTWVFFIKDYQKFWLVCCNFGRGAVDVIGSLCACLIVFRLSRLIDEKADLLAKPLAYFGRFSLLILCVHMVELDVFPWSILMDKLFGNALGERGKLALILICKVFCDLLGAWILSKIRLVRILFGYEKSKSGE